jgi:uncharacterized membrane protein (DUF4010 family)
MEMINFNLLQPFIIALFLGALMGFERTFASRMNHDASDFLGGIRTYSLVALFGSLASFIAERYASELLPLAFFGILTMTLVSHYVNYMKHNEGGITTEVSMLLCFVLGVVVQKNQLVLALFVAIVTTLVLHLKDYLHQVAERLEKEDIRAILKFAIITFLILLFDPDFNFYLKDIGAAGSGIFDRLPELLQVKVLNPYTIWIMVVLISAIGFSGYIAIKILGPRKGIGLTGLLGGLVSSTATTMTFSRRSKEAGMGVSHLPYALAVLLACSTMFPRVMVEVLAINPALSPRLAVVMGTMAFAGFAFCLFLWKKSGTEKSDDVPLKNPFNILPAVKFGLVFAAIVFIARVTEVLAGDRGVYIISVLTGLSDVDPITLTMSQISRDDPSKLSQATVAITLAAFSNTIMKAAMAWFLGSKKFRKTVLFGFGITLIAGVIGLALTRLL